LYWCLNRAFHQLQREGECPREPGIFGSPGGSPPVSEVNVRPGDSKVPDVFTRVVKVGEDAL